MLSVSTAFKTAAKSPVKVMRASLTVRVAGSADTTIAGSGDLAGYKIEATSDIISTTMRKITGNLVATTYDLTGKTVIPSMGLQLADSTWEDVSYGSFIVTEQTKNLETGTMSFVGYDMMMKSYIEYAAARHTYPCTLATFLQQVCSAIGVGNGMNGVAFTNSTLTMPSDYFDAISGITYRDILNEIAQVTGTTVMMGADDSLYLKAIGSSVETITSSEMRKFKLEPLYGPINSVVLSRMPQEDNIYQKDDASIATYGLTEMKIVNNEIVDKRRETTISSIYGVLHNVSYTPFDIDTIGLGYLEIGDKFTITQAGNTYTTLLYNYTLDIGGSFKERLYTKAQTKTETNYQRAGDLTKHLYNTEIAVDKQQQTIDSLVSDMYDAGGVVNTNYTAVQQTIAGVTTAVQNSGGNNLLRNSVGYSVDTSGNITNWTASGAGTATATSNPEAKNNGSLSGNTITLVNKTLKQTVAVKQDDVSIPEASKTYYTFSCLVKKNTVGAGYIKISNSTQSTQIDFPTGTAIFYGAYSITALLPTATYFDVEVYGDANASLTVTDMMFSVGKYKTPWTQANGETMNTQVNISVDGIVVKSSVYAGDYSIMSPLEFSGYSMIAGVLTKVFTLNKDRTEVTRLYSKNDITMPPMKIVPITSTSGNGWAIVGSST